jgi:hypothetical protein
MYEEVETIIQQADNCYLLSFVIALCSKGDVMTLSMSLSYTWQKKLFD